MSTSVDALLRGADVRLQEKIAEFDQVLRDTGCVYGLERLELMEADPIKFEKFQWRLFAGVNAARETSKYVSGSPASVGMAELVNLVALPEGEVVAASAGLAGHIGSFPLMVRAMADLGMEDNPGIRDTDIWGCNDPRFGCPHATDMYTYLPVFYEDELLCWVCGANHVADCGHAICAGGVPFYSPTTYCDGFIYGPTRIGERVSGTYVHYEPHMISLKRRTRAGSLNVLDEKMRLTGAVMLRERLFEIVADYGVEYFRQGMREILERERRAIAWRFEQWMVPGKYRQVCFRPIRYKTLMGSLFPQAAQDWITHQNQTMTLTPGGKCIVDLNGTSSQNYFWMNSNEGAFKMGATFSCLGYIGQTPLVNTALYHVLEYVRPLGSLVNPTREDVSESFGNATGSCHGTMTARAWGFATFLKGYLEEAYLLEHDWELFGAEGLIQSDVPWAIGDFTYEGGEPRGPSPWRDGEAMTIGAGNPEGDFGEVEEWEYVEPPLLTLSRSLIRDYCAHGRHRGAIGIALTQLVCDPGPYLAMNVSGYAGSDMNAVAVGCCGGYPHLNGNVVYFRDTNAFDLVAKGERLPANFREAYEMIAEGKLQVGRVDDFGGRESPPTEVKHGDIVSFAHHAGSAFGDPLDRKPDLVARDVEKGWISLNVARGVYGVVVRSVDGRWEVDEQATHEARKGIQETRKARAKPAESVYLEERQAVVTQQLPNEEIVEMFRDSLQYDSWRRHFCEFWQLNPAFPWTAGGDEE